MADLTKDCDDPDCAAHGPMLRRIEEARAQGVNEGIRISAQMVRDHTFSSNVVAESIAEFLISRADRANRVMGRGEQED